MHEIIYSIRRILPQELPTVTDMVDGTVRAATDAELLNMDIHRLYPDDDYYSCADQRVRDDETLEWSVVGVQSPGTLVSAGSLVNRHAALPNDVRPLVLRADVIAEARPVVQANLSELRAVLAEFVGDLPASGAVDESELTEARRLADDPASSIERRSVPMALVQEHDVVEVSNIIPHSWNGESRR